LGGYPRPSGTKTVSKQEHSPNACKPNDLTDSGMVIDASEVQVENVSFSMDMSETEMIIDARALQR